MSAEVPTAYAETPEEWRAWLAAHHAAERAVWLVYFKQSSGRARLSYDQAVCEALCFGWVDSIGRAADAERTQLYFARRKPGSGWARTNKARIEVLRRDGRMHPAGEAVIAAAVADGSWTLLDDVENLIVPPDLQAGFDRFVGARELWDAFPPSARRAMLDWLVHAKRPDTRARRIDQIAQQASLGVRAYPS